MEVFQEFIEKMNEPDHQERLKSILYWIHEMFPNLQPVIKWNQPMFIDHGTFIIGFSVSPNHIAVAPEGMAILTFKPEIEAAGYEHTKGIIRIKWSQPVDYALLEKIIRFNLLDKADSKTFWRQL